MALDGYPVGPVDTVWIQRVADVTGSSSGSRRLMSAIAAWSPKTGRWPPLLRR
jgi:hypothetical protein